MTEVSYHCFENPHILARLKVMMEEYKTLLPKWLNTMSIVSSNSDGDTKVLRAHYGQHEYMHARISVFPQWFDQAEKQQRIGLIHELVHIQHAALMDFTESHWIAPLEERNPELYAVIHEEYRVKLERFTESMAIAIYESMEAAKVFKASESITVHEREFQKLAQELQSAQGAIGDGKPYAGGSVCGDCGGPLGQYAKAGPKHLMCGPCWDAKYQHGNGAEPTKPYTGVSAIATKESTCRHCARPLGEKPTLGPRGLICARRKEAYYHIDDGGTANGRPNTSWLPETPCDDCGQAIGLNACHPQITRPLCPVHRDLELIVPKKGTP